MGLRKTYTLVEIVPDLVCGLVEDTVLCICELASLLPPAVDGGVVGLRGGVVRSDGTDRGGDVHLKRKRRGEDSSNKDIVPLHEGVVDGF